MTRAEIITRLRGFIEETFLYMRPDFELGDDDSLMGKGIVDSMGVMEVIAFIDEELGVTVADTDVTEQNLGTINAIANYVLARQQATQVA
ncbi:MAG: acyl carrier protein [Candidatus Cloacimonetes bacterium]|jgi:acyl carrier protein|nr:acyl carrier protein [Candidatus Cloacimonadota bacterium]